MIFSGNYQRNFRAKLMKFFIRKVLILILKRLGVGEFDPSPCDISKKLSSKERMKLWFFVTFNIIISHIFPENFIEILQAVRNL